LARVAATVISPPSSPEPIAEEWTGNDMGVFDLDFVLPPLQMGGDLWDSMAVLDLQSDILGLGILDVKAGFDSDPQEVNFF
jgi:hypothetical protein